MTKVSKPKNCEECGACITGRRGKTCGGACKRERVRRQGRESFQRRYEARHEEMPWRKYLVDMRCLTCGIQLVKKPGVRTPTRCPKHQVEHDRIRRAEKDRRRRFSRHGITEAVFNDILRAQGDACAICRSTDPVGGRGKWSLDHDHSCCPGQHSCGACIRGLLCGRCNTLLGLADERPEVLNAAALYVRRPS